MNDKRTDFDEIIQKMINDYNLTTEDLKTIIKFQLTIESGEYNPKINKKAFQLFYKKMGIRPFESEEMPEEFSSVIPLFNYNGKQMEQFASGVLLLICDKVLLLTASHVIEDVNNIFIPVKNDIFPLKGGCRYKPFDSLKNISVDIAYIDVDIELAELIKDNMKLLSISDLDWETQLKAHDFCVFTGYPYRKSNSNNNIISCRFFEYVGTYSCDIELYKQKQCSIDINIISRFNLKQTTTRFGDDIKPIVLPEGISGGGIFTSDIKVKDIIRNSNKPKLIGIAHTYDKYNHLMIGTTIGYYLKFIAKHDDIIKKEIFPHME